MTASRRTGWAAAAIVVANLLAAQRTIAASCSTLEHPIYLNIDAEQEDLVRRLARALRDNTPKPLTIVYDTTGPCTAIASVTGAVPLTHALKYIPSTQEDPNWTPSSVPLTCTPDAGGVVPDVAGASMLLDGCGVELDTGFADFPGPISSYDFAVPVGSAATAITAEEAYFVFGFGQASATTPWTSDAQLFVRTATKVPTIVTGANIMVPPAQWLGVRSDKSADVVSALEASTAPARSIGVLGTADVEAHAGTLVPLAFQAFHQRGAYYPDSTPDGHDRRNVRDGHYTLWARGTFVAPVDEHGTPMSRDTGYLLTLLAGSVPTPTPNFVVETIVAATGLVPVCAMQVARVTNGGDLLHFDHPTPCSCFFDATVGTPGPGCEPCNGNCRSGICRRGYCEAR